MTSRIPRLLQATELGVLWVTTFLFPLLVLPGTTYDEFKVPKMALLLAGVGVAGGARIARSGASQVEPLNKQMLTVAAVILVPLAASWAFSDFKEWSLVGQYLRYQGILPYMLFAAYGVLVATSFSGRTREIAWAATLSASLTGLYSVIQAFHLDPLFIVGADGLQPSFSTIGNSNFSGGWHALALPISLGLLFTESGRRREIAVAASALITCGVLFSFSQGAWLAAIAAVIAFTGFTAKRRFSRAGILGLVGAASIGIVAVAAVISVMFSQSALALLGPTVQDRAWGWEAAIRSWQEHPVIGRGPNTFALFAHEYSPFDERFHLGYRDDPHSVPLFFLASSGLIGAIGYLAAVGSVLWISSREALKKIDPQTAGLAASVIAYAVQALVSLDDPTLRLGFWGTGGAALAAATVTARRPLVGIRKLSASKLAAAAMTGILVIAIGGVASWRFLEADRFIRRGTEAALDNNADEAVTAFDRARTLRDDRWYAQVSGKNVGELATRRGASGAALFKQMQQYFGSVAQPPSPLALFTEGRLTDAWAEKVDPRVKPRAVQLLQQAHAEDPGELNHALYLAYILGDIGEHEQAIDVLEAYLRYDIQHPHFWTFWALVNARAGHDSVAWETIQTKDLPVTDPQVRRTIELLFD